MKKTIIYKYKNTTLNNSKGFDCLKKELLYSNENICIIANNSLHIQTIDEQLKDIQNKPLLLTLNQFIDEHYEYTYNKYKHTLTLLLSTLLNNQNDNYLQSILKKKQSSCKRFYSILYSI